jgi:hypothetical protein
MSGFAYRGFLHSTPAMEFGAGIMLGFQHCWHLVDWFIGCIIGVLEVIGDDSIDVLCLGIFMILVLSVQCSRGLEFDIWHLQRHRLIHSNS